MFFSSFIFNILSIDSVCGLLLAWFIFSFCFFHSVHEVSLSQHPMVENTQSHRYHAFIGTVNTVNLSVLCKNGNLYRKRHPYAMNTLHPMCLCVGVCAGWMYVSCVLIWMCVCMYDVHIFRLNSPYSKYCADGVLCIHVIVCDGVWHNSKRMALFGIVHSILFQIEIHSNVGYLHVQHTKIVFKHNGCKLHVTYILLLLLQFSFFFSVAISSTPTIFPTDNCEEHSVYQNTTNRTVVPKQRCQNNINS